MAETRSLRRVTASRLTSGRGSMLGDQARRRRWWILTLDCGHEVQRDVRYRPEAERSRRGLGGRGWAMIPQEDALPAPTRARCDTC